MSLGITNENTGYEILFKWDNKGNMLYSLDKSNDIERYMCWTEDNRLQGFRERSNYTQAEIQANLESGNLTHSDVTNMSAYYTYDALGERSMKLTSPSMMIYQNSNTMNFTTLTNLTLYASPLITLTDRGYTKHYFEGDRRVCSKIGGGFGLVELNTINRQVETIEDTYENHIDRQRIGIEKTFNCLGSQIEVVIEKQPYSIIIKDIKESRNTLEPIYYYHSDHLGSAAYLTNDNAIITQVLNYLAYGEDWVDIQNYQATNYPLLGKYTYNGKEKDYESGFHYYGSRYYSSELSIWSSTDPMADQYPNLSPYNYCANNPVMLVDPDGEEIVISKNANKEQKEAFYLFAKTKEGIKELKKYAKAGQVIAGYTYKEDGIYHKKGVNLSIEGGELTDNYRNGETEFKKTDKGLKIGVRVSPNEISSGIIGKVKTYAHEIFIHGYQYSEDFKDDGVLNSSYIKNNNLKQRTISYQQHYMDKYIYKRFETNGLKLIKEAYQIYNTANPKNTLKIPNDAEIKKMMEYRLW